jgi:hypothetical protein
MMFSVDGIERCGGHPHDDSLADLQFPANVSKKLVKKEGHVYHYTSSFPKSGWVSYEIRNANDVEQ